MGAKVMVVRVIIVVLVFRPSLSVCVQRVRVAPVHFRRHSQSIGPGPWTYPEGAAKDSANWFSSAGACAERASGC